MVREYFRMAEIQTKPTFDVLAREQKAVQQLMWLGSVVAVLKGLPSQTAFSF
jgi:hypothetical protein